MGGERERDGEGNKKEKVKREKVTENEREIWKLSQQWTTIQVG